LAAKNQQREAGDVSGIAQGAAEIATGFGGGGVGGGDPYEALYNAQQPSGLETQNPELTDMIQ
jgi:hypothetical protein